MNIASKNSTDLPESTIDIHGVEKDIQTEWVDDDVNHRDDMGRIPSQSDGLGGGEQDRRGGGEDGSEVHLVSRFNAHCVCVRERRESEGVAFNRSQL